MHQIKRLKYVTSKNNQYGTHLSSPVNQTNCISWFIISIFNLGHPFMYRIEQLRPLSRQHQLGLSLSRQAMQCPKDSTTNDIFGHWQALVAYVHDDRIAHFAIEERYLVAPLLANHGNHPKVMALGKQLLAEHEQLRTLSQLTESASRPTIDDLHTLAQALYDHIRFEEREVFPVIQELLTTKQLDTAYQQTLQHNPTK